MKIDGYIILASTQPLTASAQMPIYWHKKVAEKEAKKYGKRVVKCSVVYEEFTN